MRIGSLFSGYCGLEQGVQSVLGGTTAWVSDVDKGACKILAHRYPDVPNLGDITAVDWTQVEPVDVLTGGFPCQDVSHAGKRAGLKPDTRSGLWSHMAYAIDTLRPRLVVAENVRGLLSAAAHSDVEPCPWCVGGAGDGEPALRALGAVLGDLADLGYDARWVGLRAADVGAPHGRFRVFVVAWPADTYVAGLEGSEPAGRRHLPARGSVAPSDAGSERHGGREDAGAVGRVDGEDAGGARQRERARGVAGDRGAAAAADADRTSGEACSGRPGAGDAGRLQPVVGSGTPEWMMGYWDHGDSAQGGPGQALHGVRDSVGAQALQRPTGGQDPLPFSSDVRAVLREHQGAGDEGRTALPGAQAPGAGVLTVREDDRSSRASRGQGCREQRPVEPSDALLVVPSGAALAGGPDRATCGCLAWGKFAPVIHRWELILGATAPPPTTEGRLSPQAVEFMMGLPAGHVTDVPGLTRNEQLKALGNGVVPQQAAAALRIALGVPAAVAA